MAILRTEDGMALVEAKKQAAIFSAWARLRLDSGERIFISLSPSGFVIFRNILKGGLPIWPMWFCSSASMDERYGPAALPDEECIDTLVRLALDCRSAADVRRKFSSYPRRKK